MITIGDRYECERELGRGGMATVMLARDLVHDRLVAIKLLRPELAGALSQHRFLREIRLAAQLQHPHIVPLYDSGVHEGIPYYVMPFIEGESLRARLDRERQLPLREAVRLACDVAGALAYAHSRAVIHRDIKPENILLAGDQGMVADFGVARAVTEAAGDRLTSTGLAVGTPAYMSPEQASGDHDVDPRTDVYSLGCVLFETLAGIPPFVGPTPQAVVARRMAADAPPLRELRPSAPPELASVVARALERVPADRFSSAAEMLDALIPSIRPVSTRRSGMRAPRPRSVALAVTAALILFFVAAFGRLVWHGSTTAGHVTRARQLASVLRLSDAQHELRTALARDPADPQANLWLAQVGVMLGSDSAPDWPRAARLAAVKRNALDTLDRLRLSALLSIADDRARDPCSGARPLMDAAPGDVPALLTLADCTAQDDVVVRDSRSPSGWRYRSSRQQALRLYQQLIREYPTIAQARALVFARLSQFFITTPNQYRPGRTLTSADTLFGGFATVQGDTLVFVPYLLSDLRFGHVGAAATNTYAGLLWQRALLRSIAIQWVRDFPTDPFAHESLADALESTGETQSSTPGAPSALAEVARARELLGLRPPELVEAGLVNREMRLLVKDGQFARAAALADSVVRSAVSPTAPEADSLFGLAGLTGHLHDAIRLAQVDVVTYDISEAGVRVPVPPPLVSAAVALFADATIGAPAESIQAARQRVDGLIASYMSLDQRSAVQAALVERPMSMAVPVVGLTAVRQMQTENYLVHLEQFLARGDHRRLRDEFATLSRLRRSAWPGATSVDATYIESWVRAAAGDTAGALVELDQTLDALPATGNQLLIDLATAGSLPRMMMLRVDLDHRTGSTSRVRWAGAVCDLWVHADEVFQADRQRMCDIAHRPAQAHASLFPFKRS